MTANIIPFPRTTAYRGNPTFAARVLERARQLAAMPSWVTGCPSLNRSIMELQQNGWLVRVHASGEITCRHEKAVSLDNKPINLVDAQRIQKSWDAWKEVRG
jgi:hypothetical protein